MPDQKTRFHVGHDDPQLKTAQFPRLGVDTVEQQVQQNGSYSPLEWLLESGLLPYSAYEQWRQGNLKHLEDAIQADVADWRAWLREGEAHAKALGLVYAVQTFHDWRPEQGDVLLTLSSHAQRSRLLERRWVRPADVHQLDLFLDNGATGLEHDLRLALAARNPEKAQRHYQCLSRVAPSHPDLGEYLVLLIYAHHLEQLPTIAAEAALEELQRLVREIAPLARERLRGQAQDYLAPAWRRLAAALPQDSFDPEQPDFHASYPPLQIPDWEAVIRSVQAVPDHAEHAVLLSRLALPLHQCRHTEAAMLAFARISELVPESSPTDLVPTIATRLLHRAIEFESLDEPLSAADFPAWLLAQEPGLLHHLDRIDTPVPTGAAFLAMTELLRTRARHGDEVAARKRLQELSPALLRAYLEKSGK